MGKYGFRSSVQARKEWQAAYRLARSFHDLKLKDLFPKKIAQFAIQLRNKQLEDKTK